VKHPELQQLLTEFAAERLALLQRHEAGARAVSHYDFNNAYQYIIAREETHLTWLQDALAEFGAALPGPSATLPLPAAPKPGKNADPSAYRSVLDDDARQLGAFVARWQPRVEAMTHARHRSMLRVILGESLEHKRLFEQAVAGIEDVLGRRTGGVPRTGAVLSTRWIE
jgi:uncharacterized protein (DUF1501 family)